MEGFPIGEVTMVARVQDDDEVPTRGEDSGTKFLSRSFGDGVVDV